MATSIKLADNQILTAEQFRIENPNMLFAREFPSAGYLASIGAELVKVPDPDPTPENIRNAPAKGFGGPTIKELLL